MMAGDLARALDPVALAADLGIALDDWQARLMRERPRRALLCCARQSGKTLVTCLMAIWQALYEPGLILILSPSLRQSGECFRNLMLLYDKLRGVPELRQESILRCELANESRIISLPGQERTIRGYSKADLIVIDEAARVPDELLVAARPMLAASKDNGRLIALSTPAGKRGWFFEAWSGGDTV
jgi:tRNA(Met) C34 N-acetyltransferase TmcA